MKFAKVVNVSLTKLLAGQNILRKKERIVNDRLEKFKIQILQHRFAITDKNLFESMLEEKAINFNHSLDPLTWIFDLFRAAGSQTFDISNFGIKSLVQFNPKTIRDEINNELLELSEAHHDRYFKKINQNLSA